MTAAPLIVGLGSPHGDDQAGWRVIERLHARGISWESARVAKSPAEIWDWCRPDCALTLCDASADDAVAGTVARWTWPADAFPAQRTGTHDFPATEALSLGLELGCCPPNVTIWTISGKIFEPGYEPSSEVLAAAERLADRFWRELQSA